jgi:tetratricopeptide (TPR) repeat protein
MRRTARAACGMTARAAWVTAALVAGTAGGGCKRTDVPSTAAAPAPVAAPAAATPGNAAAQYASGKAALGDKKLTAAVAAFTQATASATDPELRANAWLGLGAAYAELGDHPRAVAAYEQVTVLRPDDADAWRVLAEGLAMAGKRDRQAQALEHVIAIDADDLSAYLDLAGLDVALGKPDRSKDVYLRYEGRRRDALLALGKAKDPKIRTAAAAILGGARDAATARALVLALTDRDANVRVACAQSLTRIGVDVDPEVRTALRALLAKEKDDKVRSAVDEALAPQQ